MSKELKFLIKLVKRASKLITNDLVINAKDDKGDIATNFDYDIEKYIVEKIKEKYPDYNIVSEEFNNKNNLTENCFVIDPIDGTKNFANGLPLWAIQLAMIKNNNTIASVIYLPILKELYTADNNGAFLNGKKLEVKKIENSVKRSIVAVEGPNKTLDEYKLKEKGIDYRDFNSTGINMAYVASNKLDGTTFLYKNPWDYIPGMYIAKMAGAYTYIDEKIKIATNSNVLLKLLLENSSKENDEELIVKKIIKNHK